MSIVSWREPPTAQPAQFRSVRQASVRTRAVDSVDPSDIAPQPLPRDEFDQLLREAERWGLDDQMRSKAFDDLALHA